jgi:molybdopterin-guanine dinucleotide biosynthesis protein A
LKDFGSALILAGGKGQRIGYDKKNIEIAGKKLIESTINSLSTVFSQIIVSSNTGFNHSGVLTLADDIGAGPLAGIYQGLKHSESAYLYVIACDMPFLSTAYIDFLQKTIRESAANACVTQREDGFLEPFNAFYHKNCRPFVETALKNGNYKILPILQSLSPAVIKRSDILDFEKKSGGNIFFNINTQADLEKAQVIASANGI